MQHGKGLETEANRRVMGGEVPGREKGVIRVCDSLSHSHVSLLGIQDADPFLCYIVSAALTSTVKTPSQSEKFYNEGKGKRNSH